MKQSKEQSATKAFLSSSGHDFAGIELGPFTPQRQAVASEMGMVWPWTKEEDLVTFTVVVKKKPVTITHYRQSYKDSVIAVWLCAQPNSRVDRAERKPEEAMSEAWGWAKKIGLNQNSQLAGEALTIWIQITNELAESKGDPVAKNGESKEPDEGEL